MSKRDEAAFHYLACNRAGEPMPFADNVAASCALCGTAIYHRPRALEDLPGARPACLPCVLRHAVEHRAQGGTTTFGVTPRTVREVTDLVRRAQGRRP